MLLNTRRSILTIIALSLFSLSATAGTQVLATRLIFLSNKKEASVQVQNTGEEAVLIQRWVDPYQANVEDQNNELTPFFSMPPLNRLNTKQHNTVRVRRSNQAYQQLQWQVIMTPQTARIQINNPTPCFITLAEANINQTDPLSLNPTPMIAPFSSMTYAFVTEEIEKFITSATKRSTITATSLFPLLAR